MVAVQDMDNLRDSPGTHRPVVSPRVAGGMQRKKYCVPEFNSVRTRVTPSRHIMHRAIPHILSYPLADPLASFR